jgi:hypothetical protein
MTMPDRRRTPDSPTVSMVSARSAMLPAPLRYNRCAPRRHHCQGLEMKLHHRLSVWIAPAMLGACTAFIGPFGPSLRAGQTEGEVQSMLGAPTGRYALDGGLTRLEYATGPFGRHTWMVDLDASGRVVRHDQVLNERHFAEIQQKAPGMSREQLLRELGRPGEVHHGGLRGGRTWVYRYPTNDCLWFMVSVAENQRVESASYGIDWSCDARNDARQ